MVHCIGDPTMIKKILVLADNMAAYACSFTTPHNYENFIRARKELEDKLNSCCDECTRKCGREV